MSYPYPGGSAPPDGGYGGGYGYPYAPPYGYLPYPPGGGYPMAPTGAAYGVPPHAGGGVSRMPPPYNMQPQPQPQSSPHPPQRKVARPCAFFLRGQCKKRDLCNFIHDYASLPQGQQSGDLSTKAGPPEPLHDDGPENPPPEVEIRTLFIGNVTPSVKDADLVRVFSDIGEVESTKILHDKAIGFVQMKTRTLAEQAYTALFGKLEIHSASLTVKWASLQQQRHWKLMEERMKATQANREKRPAPSTINNNHHNTNHRTAPTPVQQHQNPNNNTNQTPQLHPPYVYGYAQHHGGYYAPPPPPGVVGYDGGYYDGGGGALSLGADYAQRSPPRKAGGSSAGTSRRGGGGGGGERSRYGYPPTGADYYVTGAEFYGTGGGHPNGGGYHYQRE